MPRRLRVSLAAAALVCVVAGGCRVPDPPVLSEPRAAVIYDTEYEGSLTGPDQPPLVRGVFDRYVETLDEPVSVVAADEGGYTCEVFFATNRALEAAGAGSNRERFGNEALAHPLFGRVEATIPRRARGEAVCATPDKPRRRILPARWNSPVDPGPANFKSVRSLPRESFLRGVQQQVAASRQKDLLIFVHGFNVDFDSAAARAAQLAIDLPFNGAIVAYSWPTQGGLGNYEADEAINAASTAPFTEFLLSTLDALPEGTRVHIIVHSMGNRIVLRALDELPRNSGKRLANLCLCAPDVGLSDYAEWIDGAVAQAERVTMYTHCSDSALIISKGLHAEARVGDAHLPAIADEVEMIDCSRIDQSLMGHSYFSENVSVLTDLFAVLKENRSARDRPWLAPERTREGQPYWSFQEHPGVVQWVWHFDEAATAEQ